MAITYGMSVKEFWEENPDLFWAYRFSYLSKMKFENENLNFQAWLQGAYVNEAVSVALNNAFNKNKIEYSKVPYALEKREETAEEKKRRTEIEVANLKARIAQVNKIRRTANEGNTKGGEKVNE